MFKKNSNLNGNQYVKQIMLLKEENQKQERLIKKLTIEVNKYTNQPNTISQLEELIMNIRRENKSLIRERDALKSKYNNLKYISKRMNLKNDNQVPYRIKRDVYERDNHTCLVCGTTENLTIDHIKPRIMGGTNNINNLQTLCKHCNLEKGIEVIDYRNNNIKPLIERKKSEYVFLKFTKYDGLEIKI